MSTVTIYHNPRCSKSRATLALLEARGITPRVIEYLKDPPSPAELGRIATQLGIRPGELVRKNEDVYQRDFAARTLTDAEWLDALARHPVLIERPIVVVGDRAAIGRPPENVLSLLPP
jgi:arsenate reductase